MDERCTLPVGGEFTEIIKEVISGKKHADLIIDTNGLERASGLIMKIDETTNPSEILLDNGQRIAIPTIVAINGLFKSDYSCC